MTADIHALAGAYALDALPPEEQAFFERHLADCEPCRQEVREFREVAAHLGSAVAEAPAATFREHILARADRMRQLPPRLDDRAAGRFGGRLRRTLLAVAAAVVLGAALAAPVLVDLAGEDGPEVADEVAGLLNAPDRREAALTGPGRLRFIYSEALDLGLLVGHGVAAAPAGETYKLWLVHDGQPQPAPAFAPQTDGVASVVVHGRVTDAEEVAVTIEPDPDATAPTGQIIASAPTG